MRDFDDEYKWMQKQNLNKFKGRWIAVVDKKIVGSGLYADDVVKEIKKKSTKKPLLIKVATEKYLFQ
jgi:hypothetical protein